MQNILKSYVKSLPKFKKLINNHVISLITIYLLICIVYRIWMICSIPESHVPFNPIRIAGVALGFVDDLLFGVGLLVFLIIFDLSLCLLGNFKVGKFFFSLLQKSACVVVLLTIAIIFVVYRKIFLILGTGINSTLLESGFQQGFTLNDYSPYLHISDFMFIFFPVLIFFIINNSSKEKILNLNCYIIFPVIWVSMSLGMLVTNYYSYNFFRQKDFGDTISYANPVRFLTSSFFGKYNNKLMLRRDLPIAKQLHSIQLIDSIFVNKDSPKTFNSVVLKKKNYNVVLVILESVGSDYIFDTSNHLPMPMPFFFSLSKKGLYGQNNYSPGNTSPLGTFGVMTGIYPPPIPSNFTVRPDVHIPALGSFLGKSYDSFFVTAGLARFYFPESLLRNSFNEFYDGNMSYPNKQMFAIYMNEEQSSDFFLKRLENAKPPFFATYWSGAAHHPYFYYGKKYAVRGDQQNSKDAYYNNLRLLDNVIQNIFTLLKKKQWLENTIIVIVGDHGEGFGQHFSGGGFGHGLALYQEQIKVPLLFYQPSLFPAESISEATSSIDILPTIMDALNIQYDKRLLQGESLLDNNYHNRKYIFVYGREDEIAMIDYRNQSKVQLSFETGACVRYNLNEDSGETRGLPCGNQSLITTIIKYRNYQSALLPWYNQELKSEQKSAY